MYNRTNQTLIALHAASARSLHNAYISHIDNCCRSLCVFVIIERHCCRDNSNARVSLHLLLCESLSQTYLLWLLFLVCFLCLYNIYCHCRNYNDNLKVKPHKCSVSE